MFRILLKNIFIYQKNALQMLISPSTAINLPEQIYIAISINRNNIP